MKMKKETPEESAMLERQVASVQALVAKHYGMNGEMIARARGKADVAFKRQVAMALSWTETKASCTLVGRLFGRGHSAVLHAVKAVEEASEAYPEVGVTVEKLRTKARSLVLK